MPSRLPKASMSNSMPAEGGGRLTSGNRQAVTPRMERQSQSLECKRTVEVASP